MIVEIADLSIQPGQQASFLTAFAAASKVIARATGYRQHVLQHCLERDTRFVLLVEWETLEDHTEGFRQSPLFAEWRALIGPYFAAPPTVEHFAQVWPTGQTC